MLIYFRSFCSKYKHDVQAAFTITTTRRQAPPPTDKRRSSVARDRRSDNLGPKARAACQRCRANSVAPTCGDFQLRKTVQRAVD
ncbi:unnamed protein product [Arctia plantaginis]|uniref:Uncharacterized protein n=1 Tax=Arctia plantaginis TaxID=874455 RepID=A0A8S1BGD3_ARCPL|nr:unnamed protein product [Arctia plantaginis]